MFKLRDWVCEDKAQVQAHAGRVFPLTAPMQREGRKWKLFQIISLRQ